MLAQMLGLAGVTKPELAVLTGKTVAHIGRWERGDVPIPEYVYTILDLWGCSSPEVRARLLRGVVKREGKGRRSNEEVWALARSLGADARRIVIAGHYRSWSRWALATELAKTEGCPVTAQQILKRYMETIEGELSDYWDEEAKSFHYHSR